MTAPTTPTAPSPLRQKLVLVGVVLALVVALGLMVWHRLVGGERLEATHRRYLDGYVADLRAGRPTTPSATTDVALSHLSRAASWQVRSVRTGIGFDGRGSSCWELDAVTAQGERASLVLGVRDDDGPIRIAGWGMQPGCRCPRSPQGSLLC